jgi:hypothetical protein
VKFWKHRKIYNPLSPVEDLAQEPLVKRSPSASAAVFVAGGERGRVKRVPRQEMDKTYLKTHLQGSTGFKGCPTG